MKVTLELKELGTVSCKLIAPQQASLEVMEDLEAIAGITMARVYEIMSDTRGKQSDGMLDLDFRRAITAHVWASFRQAGVDVKWAEIRQIPGDVLMECTELEEGDESANPPRRGEPQDHKKSSRTRTSAGRSRSTSSVSSGSSPG
jgi:hypothetical protein